MILVAPLCYGCSRLREGDETCDAYPTGIPDAILGNEVDHRLPYQGDHGLAFAPVEPWAADYAVDVFGPGPAVPAEPVPVLGFSNGVVTVAYSPQQPRRSDGKFGTGGGGGGFAAPAAADGKTTADGFQPGGKGGGVSGVLNVPEMSVEEATKRMQAAVPGMRVYQIEQMDPRIRHATTVAVEAMAKKFPEATHSADLGQPLPRGIYVMGATEAREKANIRNLAGNGALAANGNIVFNKSKVGLNGGLEETEAYARGTSVGSSTGLPWASVSKLTTKMNSIEGTVAHEWGHVVDQNVFNRMASDARLPAGSRYAEKNHAERWAEGFTEWAGGLDTPAAQWVGKRLADRGIVTR